MKRIVAFLAVAFYLSTVTLLVVRRGAVTPAASADQSALSTNAWQILPREASAVAGLNAGYQKLADDLAPISTSAETRASIVRYLTPRILELDASEKDLVDSVRARLGIPVGVACVASGAFWVPR